MKQKNINILLQHAYEWTSIPYLSKKQPHEMILDLIEQQQRVFQFHFDLTRQTTQYIFS